ncbi:MAG: SMC-Scp complex subunit ScpB [Deltaproteobacteria bacterium]
MEEEKLPAEPVETAENQAETKAQEPPAESAAPNKQEDNVMAVIESLLFAYDRPLTVEQIRKVMDNLDAGQVRSALTRLSAEYENGNRGMRVIEVAGGYKMISTPHFASFLRKLFKGPQNTDKLSGPAMETLAIIAYKQPLSKMEIESLRKVNADGVVATLMEKSLIRVVGRKDAPGRPKVYGTSREFLEYFGLKSLDDLPKLEQFPLSPEKQREILEKFAAPAEGAPQEEKGNAVPEEPSKTD